MGPGGSRHCPGYGKCPQNGDKPHTSKRGANKSSLGISGGTGVGRVTNNRGREFERKKRCS